MTENVFVFVRIVKKTYFYYFSRVILTYLTAAYSKDDTLYPRDVRMRALVDHRLQFDLSTLYARLFDYFVSIFLHFYMNLEFSRIFNLF